MKLVALISFLGAAGTVLQTPAPAARRGWIDPVTGHRVIRISETPDKKWVVFTGQFAPRERHVYAVETARQK
jgi:hypothetical protein